MGITHNFHFDTVIGIIIADFVGGLSIGWWKRDHNIHHVVTNSPEHDPDIQHMSFIAVSHRFLGNLRSTFYDRIMKYDGMARLILSVQQYTYYLLLAFGRFNLYFRSWEYLLLGLGPRKGSAWWHRHLEILGQMFFWVWFGYGILYRSIPTQWHRFIFITVSHITVMPLHAQIGLSHFAISTTEMGTFRRRCCGRQRILTAPPGSTFSTEDYSFKLFTTFSHASHATAYAAHRY